MPAILVPPGALAPVLIAHQPVDRAEGEDGRREREQMLRIGSRQIQDDQLRTLSGRTKSIWDSQRAVVAIQAGCWVEEASDE